MGAKMRLNEIFEDVDVTQLKKVERALDAFVYQPPDKVQKSKPVLDVEIPTKSSDHFIQRFNERNKTNNFNLGQVYELLKAAKTDPSLGYADELDTLSREDHPHETINIKDKGKDALVVPVIVQANPEARRISPNNPVALDRQGKKVPKNQLKPKTIFRKGVQN
jgi:hypothetical protein